MGFDLHSIGLAVDERRHAGGTETDAVVVKVFAVNALHGLPTVLVARRSQLGLEGAVSALFRFGLVGPRELVFWRHRR